MKEHQILFNAEMVKAILDNRKSQTRRLMKPQPLWGEAPGIDDRGSWCGRYQIMGKDGYPSAEVDVREPKYQPGDILAIHEVIGREPCPECGGRKHKLIHSDPHDLDFKFQPCPNELCDDGWIVKTRDTGERREVSAVRCERVQEISEEDAEAEGVIPYMVDSGAKDQNDQWIEIPEYKPAFADFWDSIYEKRGFGWDVNPWNWCYELEVLSGE